MPKKAEVGDYIISRDKFYRYRQVFKVEHVRIDILNGKYIYWVDIKRIGKTWFQLDNPNSDYYAEKISLDKKDYE